MQRQLQLTNACPPDPHPPTHPPAAFLTPDAIALLVKEFNLTPADTKHPAEEVERMMRGAGEVARGR